MLHREETGSGEPLVLVHGAWADGRHWTRLARELADGFRVVSYDRRGHGRSGGAHGTIGDDAQDLLELIADLGGRAHVVAGSLGGTIALSAATKEPAAVTSLAVHEPALPALMGGAPQAPERIPSAKEFAEDSLGEGAWERLTEEERKGFEDNGDVWAAELADATAGAVRPEPLPMPLLVTIGGVSPPFWRKVAEQIPGATIEEIPGAGHLPHLTHAREYAAAIAPFAGPTR
ncbi:MAG TPA: alpha/beta fold hydrolase [Thermoleophilaceae bacterium]|nr:alpha/beta fold hydrolase [Thermoleophilaceae bacterium]